MARELKPPTIQERDWQAEDDAVALMRAKEIESDKKRFKSAIKKAEQMALKKEKEAKMMKSISGKGAKSASKKGKK